MSDISPAGGFGEGGQKIWEARVCGVKTVEAKDRYVKLLIKSYTDWTTMLKSGMNTITQLIPDYPNLSQGEGKTSVDVTKESLAKFASAEASINAALILMKRDLEDIYRIQHLRETKAKAYKETTKAPKTGNGK